MAIARPIDRRLFFIFDRAHTQLSKEADNYLASSVGISTSQASVLIYLGYHDKCRLTDLAQGTGTLMTASLKASRKQKLALCSSFWPSRQKISVKKNDKSL